LDKKYQYLDSFEKERPREAIESIPALRNRSALYQRYFEVTMLVLQSQFSFILHSYTAIKNRKTILSFVYCPISSIQISLLAI